MSTFGTIIKKPFTITGSDILSSGGSDIVIHTLSPDEQPLGIFLTLVSPMVPDDPCTITLSVYSSTTSDGNFDVFTGVGGLDLSNASVPWNKCGGLPAGDDPSEFDGAKLVWAASISNGSPSSIDGEISGEYVYAKFTP